MVRRAYQKGKKKLFETAQEQGNIRKKLKKGHVEKYLTLNTVIKGQKG